MSTSKSCAVPPPPPHRNTSTGGEEGYSEENAFSVSAAKAFFEAAKRPEVQKAAMAAAKNPIIRNAAISAAKNPETRNQMMNMMVASNQKPTPPPKKVEDSKPAPPPHRTPPKDYSSKPVPAVPKSTYGSSSNSYGTSSASSSTGVSSIVSELQSLNLKKVGDTSSNLCMPSQVKPSRPPPVQHVQPTYQKPAQPALSAVKPTPNVYSTPLPPPIPNTTRSVDHTSGPHAYVSYEFSGSQFDELSSKIGDLIVLKREVDNQWIYGFNTRTEKHGIIPINYLDIKTPLASSQTSSYSNFSAPTHIATALYDYNSPAAEDLQFRANDQIKLIEWVNSDWLRGELFGRSGIFPANFVTCATIHAVPYSSSYTNMSVPSAPLTTMYAAYDYNSGVADDLILSAGEQVDVMEYIGSDWIRGTSNGMTGLVPMSFLTSNPMKKSPSGLASISTIGSVRQLATVLEDHQTNDSSNLYVSKGDRILIVEDVDEYLYSAKLEEFKSLPAGLIPKRKIVLD